MFWRMHYSPDLIDLALLPVKRSGAVAAKEPFTITAAFCREASGVIIAPAVATKAVWAGVSGSSPAAAKSLLEIVKVRPVSSWSQPAGRDRL